MIDRSRVRLVWWYPGWPQVTTPLGMVLVLIGALVSPLAWDIWTYVAIASLWGFNLTWHYTIRRRELRQFWAGLEPDWEEKARAQGWEPERALAVYVHMFNDRHYNMPVLRLVPPA